MEISLFEFELPRLELRLDVLDEMEVGFLGVRIVGVAGHCDIAAGRFLIERGGQLAPVQEPALELRC